MSTYRVIIAGTTLPDGFPPGTWCSDAGRGIWENYPDADRFADVMRRLFPTTDYRVLCTTGLSNSQLDAIATSFARRPTSAPAGYVPPTDDQEDDDDMDDDDDEPDIYECEHCGHHDEDDCDHVFYTCDNCGWGCEVPDCEECLLYSDNYDGDLCDSCYEDHQYGRGEGSPGLRVRRCSVCDSGDVHHDEVNDRFVCDHIARQLLDDRYPVRLNHALPTLEVA